MGARVSKKDVKVPHFYFGEVTKKNEFNKELITVSKKMMMKDQYNDWLKKYRQAKTLNYDSLLLPQTFEIEEIKKYFACCECPADFEMSVSS